MSPTWWITQVCNELFGGNPIDFLTPYLAGDWETFAKCALIWEQMSGAVGAVGQNVHNGLTWLSVDWQGHAAAAAMHYFSYADVALATQRDVFHEFYKVYYDVASVLRRKCGA